MPDTNKIKARMAELGMTQADLAGKLGIATPTMCQKINNLRPFTLEEAEIVADALKISNQDFGTYFFAS